MSRGPSESDDNLTVDAIAAGILKMTLMIAFRFSSMKTVAIRFATKLKD